VTTPAPTSETQDLGLLARAAVLSTGGGRELIVASGADRIRFLHGIVTADVAGTPVGSGSRSALLTPKGHVLADMWLFVREEAVWIVVDPGQAEPTAAALGRYAIMDDFAAGREPEFAAFAVLGPEAAGVLSTAGLPGAVALAARPALSHLDARTDAGDVWLVRVRELGADGFWVGGRRAVVAARLRALEEARVPQLARAAAEAARVAALEPRWGAEITPDYFPMEVGLSGAIDYGKGCYLGQEPIVRVRDRGHINWRLVGLAIAAGAPMPSPADPLESGVKPRAGRVTSAARLPGGEGVALAMLHVSVPVGAEVRIKHADGLIAARVTAEVAA
jgi:folate-binding protein YgfZ